MLPITGYANKLSILPGEKIEVKISSQSHLPYQVQVTRVVCADPHPEGPGRQETPSDAMGRLPSQPGCASGIRVIHLQPPQRQKRCRLFITFSTPAESSTWLPDFPSRHWIGRNYALVPPLTHSFLRVLKVIAIILCLFLRK
jgi:hypothetical protein